MSNNVKEKELRLKYRKFWNKNGHRKAFVLVRENNMQMSNLYTPSLSVSTSSPTFIPV